MRVPSGDQAGAVSGSALSVSAANAASFQQKWDDFDALLDGGTPSSVVFNESEVSSRANQYFTEESDLDLIDGVP